MPIYVLGISFVRLALFKPYPFQTQRRFLVFDFSFNILQILSLILFDDEKNVFIDEFFKDKKYFNWHEIFKTTSQTIEVENVSA